MFLTLGMTADVAAAHRHEFSGAQPDSRPRRPLSWLPFFAFPTLEAKHDDHINSPSTDTAIASPASDSLSNPSPPVLPSHDESVRAAQSIGSSTISRSNSILSDGTTAAKSSAMSSRSKTSFLIAQPPPALVHRQRLSIRPKLLLQIQQISATASSRPTPLYDVLPSTIFAPLMARKHPKMFRGRGSLDDVVIVSRDDHHRLEAPQEEAGSGSVVATICQLRKDEGGDQGKAEICFRDGPTWTATPLSTGGYEFVSISGTGSKITARWVPRKLSSPRRPAAVSGGPSKAAQVKKKFIFSIINPTSRRHPVIATLTHTSIDILDSYPASPGPLVVSVPQSPGVTPSASDHMRNSFFEDTETSPYDELLLVDTDDMLRALIIMTGVWVAFREGWSDNFSYDRSSSSIVRQETQIPALTQLPSNKQKNGNQSTPRISSVGTRDVADKNLARTASLSQTSDESMTPSKGQGRLRFPRRSFSADISTLGRTRSDRRRISSHFGPDYSVISPAVSEEDDILPSPSSAFPYTPGYDFPDPAPLDSAARVSDGRPAVSGYSSGASMQMSTPPNERAQGSIGSTDGSRKRGGKIRSLLNSMRRTNQTRR